MPSPTPQYRVRRSEVFPHEADNWQVDTLSTGAEICSAIFVDHCGRADAEEYAAWKAGRSFGGKSTIPEGLTFEVHASADPEMPGAWIASAFNQLGSGEFYTVYFVGCDARERAQEYAAWKNAG